MGKQKKAMVVQGVLVIISDEEYGNMGVNDLVKESVYDAMEKVCMWHQTKKRMKEIELRKFGDGKGELVFK